MVVIVELGNLRIVALNQAAAWRVPLLRRQAQPGILAQRIHRLNKTLTETGLADDQRAIVILKCAGHDLGRAGTLWIDQHDQRESVVGV